jgi:peptidyl-prolyl cis-trans isomerase D
MFDWVEKHKRWIQLVLLVLIVPSFALFGINYYFDEYGDSGEVAKVAGTKITPQEFDNALRERQEQLRQMMKDQVDTAMLDSNEVRIAVVNDLVDRRALLSHALHSGLAVPDAEVQRIIAEIPSFQDPATGKFSMDRYRQVLKSQGMTPVMFEERLRHDLRVTQARDSVTGSVVLADAVVDRLGKIREQRRELSYWVLAPEQLLSRVSVSDEEVKKFYDDNQKDFRIPERVRVAYVTLTPDVAGRSVTVSDEEIADYYAKNEAQYRSPEQRRARHILIAVAKDAAPAAREEARKRAESLAVAARRNPAAFPELARKISEDPGSAANGGDLGLVGRGAMVKPFEDAMFAMKPGEVAGLRLEDLDREAGSRGHPRSLLSHGSPHGGGRVGDRQVYPPWIWNLNGAAARIGLRAPGTGG